MIDVRPATQEDLEYLRQNPLEEALKGYPQLRICDSNTYTAVLNGEVVGIGGVVVLWKGVGEAWVILSRNCQNKPIEMFLCIKRVYKALIQSCELNRIQVVVRVDFPQSIKMIEKLGFEREGLMRRYCPDGCDAYMYARIL